MADDFQGGATPPTGADGGTRPEIGPQSVPELVALDRFARTVEGSVGPDGSEAPAADRGGRVPEAVTDEDRTRFGVLLDRAAERGLLTTPEYQRRLTELYEATSVDRMTELVTEYPSLTTASPPRGSRPVATATSGIGLDLLVHATPVRRRVNPWVLLAALLLVIAVAMVVLVVTFRDVSRNHPGGMPPNAVAGQLLSAPRP